MPPRSPPRAASRAAAARRPIWSRCIVLQVKGRRQSLEITGIFGFDVYDFAEDLNVQALGEIFEQSLKDIEKRTALVRGVGETALSNPPT